MKEYRLKEVRAIEEDEKMIVEGYAVVFDSITDLGDWLEVIDRNAFDGCDMSDVCMKYNHEDNVLIMARTRNNSLQLEVDDKGLKIRAQLIDTTTNRDIYKSIKSKLLDKMSFGFVVQEAEWDINLESYPNEYGKDLRKITKIAKLFDVSVVDFPAYEETSIEARNIEEVKKELEQVKEEKQKLELEKEKLLLLLSL